ncbi:MAG: hypothetical protein ABI743_04455 [bacterium]
MRRFALPSALMLVFLCLGLAPIPSVAEPNYEQLLPRFHGQQPQLPEFPSFLIRGTGHVYGPNETLNAPQLINLPFQAQAGQIVLLKARSSDFYKNPNWAPLAGPFVPRGDHTPATFPYSLIAVPQDREFHYQATYIRSTALPVNLGLANTDLLPHLGPGGTTGPVTWDYRYALTSREDQHEAQFIGRSYTNDADQNVNTIDFANGRSEWFWPPLNGQVHERSFFHQSDTNFDHEDLFGGVADNLPGTLYLTLRTGNDTWSNWRFVVRVFDHLQNEVAVRKTSGQSLEIQIPITHKMAHVNDLNELDWLFRVQVFGTPKSKPEGSNVYYVPYSLTARLVPN